MAPVSNRSWLFVCQVFYPDEQATSQLFSDLFAQLAIGGASTTVLCGRPRECSVPSEEIWRGVRILRGGLRLDSKKSMACRAAVYGSYCLWLVFQLLRGVGGNARVLVVTNPPFAPLLVWLCSSIRPRPFDIFLLDIYPDGLIALGGLRETSLITRLWRWANRRAFEAADHIIVLGRDMAELCMRRYGVAPERIRYFPHWSPIHMTVRTRMEDNAFWKRNPQLQGRFIVQYSGNMGLWHDIETIVRAAALLQSDQRIQFLMIGAGMRKQAAVDLCRNLAIGNVSWLPFQPKEELADSLSCCHAAIISQRAGLDGIAVPCKLYGILASGRAILAQVPARCETARVVEEEMCGQIIPPGDAVALAEAVRRFVSDQDLVQKMGENAFAAYRRKYTLSVAVHNFTFLT